MIRALPLETLKLVYGIFWRGTKAKTWGNSDHGQCCLRLVLRPCPLVMLREGGAKCSGRRGSRRKGAPLDLCPMQALFASLVLLWTAPRKDQLKKQGCPWGMGSVVSGNEWMLTLTFLIFMGCLTLASKCCCQRLKLSHQVILGPMTGITNLKENCMLSGQLYECFNNRHILSPWSTQMKYYTAMDYVHSFPQIFLLQKQTCLPYLII